MKKVSNNNKYCQEVAEEICARIADGDSESEIERSGLLIGDEKISISKDTITAWKRKHPEFRKMMADANAVSDIGIFNKIHDLGTIDLVAEALRVDALDLSLQLKTTLLTQMCNQNKERISNLWRRLKILKPEKYGDRIMQDINWKDKVDNMTNETLDKELKKVLDKAMSDISNL